MSPSTEQEIKQVAPQAWNAYVDAVTTGWSEIEAGINLGAQGPAVLRIQQRLRDLGYPLGAEDGVYGPTMARTVAAFKRDQLVNVGAQLEPGDTIGRLTIAALDTAHPIQLSPDRENATEQMLLDKGSTEMRKGQDMQNVGRGLAGTGAFFAVDQTGILDQLANSVQILSPLIRSLQWVGQHWFWLLLIGGGVYCWRAGFGVKAARLLAHQLGFNLSR